MNTFHPGTGMLLLQHNSSPGTYLMEKSSGTPHCSERQRPIIWTWLTGSLVWPCVHLPQPHAVPGTLWTIQGPSPPHHCSLSGTYWAYLTSPGPSHLSSENYFFRETFWPCLLHPPEYFRTSGKCSQSTLYVFYYSTLPNLQIYRTVSCLFSHRLCSLGGQNLAQCLLAHGRYSGSTYWMHIWTSVWMKA